MEKYQETFALLPSFKEYLSKEYLSQWYEHFFLLWKFNFLENGTVIDLCVLSCSVMSDSFRPHGLYVACQAPLSMGILQARILEWVAMPSSRGSCQPRDWTPVSCIAGEFITVWVTREAKNTGVGSLSLFQGIFLTQESSGGGVGGSPALQADSLPAELPGNYICFRYTT